MEKKGFGVIAFSGRALSAGVLAFFVAVGAFVAAGCEDRAPDPSSSSSGSGGDGGAGGAGGSGGGGDEVVCLDAAMFAEHFSINTNALCAVAIFDAPLDLSLGAVPNWGRHGGPMTVSLGNGGSLDVARWEVPAGSMGSLKATVTSIPAAVPEGAFPGVQAIDLPFFNWTAVSWAGSFPSTEGELVLADGTAIEQRYDVQSFFAGVGVADNAGQGRLLYTGMSPLEDPAVSKNALYAADSCGTEAAMPRLLPEGDPTCGAPSEIIAWGEFSGPVVADSDGNVFAVMSSFSSDTQELRAFEASTVARGETGAAGSPILQASGYGTSLAALAPTEVTSPQPAVRGIVAFQPISGMDGPQDVIGQFYVVEGSTVKPWGAEPPDTLLKLAKPGTSLALLSDDQDRMWVGVPVSGATRFVVLAMKK